MSAQDALPLRQAGDVAFERFPIRTGFGAQRLAVCTRFGPQGFQIGVCFGSDGLNFDSEGPHLDSHVGSDGLNLPAKTGGHGEDQGGQADPDTDHRESFLTEPGHCGSPVEPSRFEDESFRRVASATLNDALCGPGIILPHGSGTDHSSACESRNVVCRPRALRRSVERAWRGPGNGDGRWGMRWR